TAQGIPFRNAALPHRAWCGVARLSAPMLAKETSRMAQRYPPVSIFGVPTDIGAGTRGASMGPAPLRVAGRGEAPAARGVDEAETGDVYGPKNPWRGPVDGYRHLDEVVAWNRAVHEASAA